MIDLKVLDVIVGECLEKDAIVSRTLIKEQTGITFTHVRNPLVVSLDLCFEKVRFSCLVAFHLP